MPSTFPEPRRRVAVTAIGVVSPLGLGLAETLEALRTGRDCVTPVTRFDVSRNRAKTAGQIPALWEVEANETPSRHQLHPASHMLSAAVREAVAGDPEFQP